MILKKIGDCSKKMGGEVLGDEESEIPVYDISEDDDCSENEVEVTENEYESDNSEDDDESENEIEEILIEDDEEDECKNSVMVDENKKSPEEDECKSSVMVGANNKSSELANSFKTQKDGERNNETEGTESVNNLYDNSKSEIVDEDLNDRKSIPVENKGSDTKLVPVEPNVTNKTAVIKAQTSDNIESQQKKPKERKMLKLLKNLNSKDRALNIHSRIDRNQYTPQNNNFRNKFPSNFKNNPQNRQMAMPSSSKSIDKGTKKVELGLEKKRKINNDSDESDMDEYDISQSIKNRKFRDERENSTGMSWGANKERELSRNNKGYTNGSFRSEFKGSGNVGFNRGGGNRKGFGYGWVMGAGGRGRSSQNMRGGRSESGFPTEFNANANAIPLGARRPANFASSGSLLRPSYMVGGK